MLYSALERDELIRMLKTATILHHQHLNLLGQFVSGEQRKDVPDLVKSLCENFERQLDWVVKPEQASPVTEPQYQLTEQAAMEQVRHVLGKVSGQWFKSAELRARIVGKIDDKRWWHLMDVLVSCGEVEKRGYGAARLYAARVQVSKHKEE